MPGAPDPGSREHPCERQPQAHPIESLLRILCLPTTRVVYGYTRRFRFLSAARLLPEHSASHWGLAHLGGRIEALIAHFSAYI